MLPIAAIILGLGLGFATGGRTRSIPVPSTMQAMTVVTLYVAQALVRGVAGASHSLWWSWSLIGLLLAAALWASPSVNGARLASAGVALNALVVALNGGMPVGTDSKWGSIATARPFYLLNVKNAAAAVLADVLPIHLLGSTTLISIGDLLLSVAVCAYITNGMHSGESDTLQEFVPSR